MDMISSSIRRIGLLTSGGDAPGMNAAVRSVVRTALDNDLQPYAIHEGYQGMIDGGKYIREMTWDSVGGILYKGGTIIGTARSDEFMQRAGRLKAAFNLITHEIDSLVVIGGDGSLQGANILFKEWAGLLEELVQDGQIEPELASRHPSLKVVGLVGSIDNDMVGIDITIGADSALHRITDAIDAIYSTAASHQRTFVVEVMGRNSGYLALMAGLATGSDWVLIPESPPDVDNWEETMTGILKAGRKVGRRETIVVVAEGARDRHGNPISGEHVREVLQEHLGEETRLTILGHIQRGGSPSAFDRNMGTLLGFAAVKEILSADNENKDPQLIGFIGNRISSVSLPKSVEDTRSVNNALTSKSFQLAMNLRGSGFKEAFRTLRTMVRALPHPVKPGQERFRIAIIHCGSPAPGMNTAVRAAVRFGMDRGHTMLGVYKSFEGFASGKIQELDWMSVNGWASLGGAELGTNRNIPHDDDLDAIIHQIKKNQIQGILMIGGWNGYISAYKLHLKLKQHPELRLPIVCLPATINNNLPGSELSIGADTALNNIIGAVDKIKQSAVAQIRCFVVEVMGRDCGYLALMSGLATGAEKVYLNEEGITLQDLLADLDLLKEGFNGGKRLGLMIRNEHANPVYTTEFLTALFEEEGGDLFDVRQAKLGHLQQGGNPTPFDRIQATKFSTRCVQHLIDRIADSSQESSFIGLQGKDINFHNLEDFPAMIDKVHERPKHQWWLDLHPISRVLAKPGPQKKYTK
jgi:6-phosphofructokinase 1